MIRRILKNSLFWELVFGNAVNRVNDTFRLADKTITIEPDYLVKISSNGCEKKIRFNAPFENYVSFLLSRISTLAIFENKRILVAGGTGTIGRFLRKTLSIVNARVATLGRNPETADHTTDYRSFISTDLGSYDIIINLCGTNVLKVLFHKESFYEIERSRLDPARFLVNKIKSLKLKPYYVQASAVGIYDKCAASDENSSLSLSDPISKLIKNWEEPAYELESFSIFRFGVVLGKETLPVKFAKLGKWLPIIPYIKSEAIVPWTAIEDILAYLSLAYSNRLTGPINVVSGNTSLIELHEALFQNSIKMPIPIQIVRFLNPYFDHLLLRNHSINSVYKQLLQTRFNDENHDNLFKFIRLLNVEF
ncbi:MAG: hypothetical protein N2654_05215 [Deltaproteobacteria bacterium]|nr:hypothetical protein [Deltaproteobacteria bacterium]